MLSFQPDILTRILSTPNTEAGPSFVRKYVLHASWTNQIEHGYLLDVQDAEMHPLNLFGIINLVMQPARYNERVTFFVCDWLAAPIVLGPNSAIRLYNPFDLATKRLNSRKDSRFRSLAMVCWRNGDHSRRTWKHCAAMTRRLRWCLLWSELCWRSIFRSKAKQPLQSIRSFISWSSYSQSRNLLTSSSWSAQMGFPE